MTPEQNKAIIQQHHDRLNRGDYEAALTDVAENTGERRA